MKHENSKGMNPYPRFGAMIATSTVVMFGLMYLNTLNGITSTLVKPALTWRFTWAL